MFVAKATFRFKYKRCERALIYALTTKITEVRRIHFLGRVEK